MKFLIDWVLDNVWMIGAVMGGIIVSILTSEDHTLKMALVRDVTGCFCAIFLTHPLLDILGRDPAIYGNAVAGLLAMTGYAIAKNLAHLTGAQLAEWVAIVLGRKK